MRLESTILPNRRKSAPPDDAFARLLADDRLSSTCKVIAATLVKKWAWSKPLAWPSNRSIGAAVGKSPSQVARCLAVLEKCGYVRREMTAEVATGRIIHLLWRSPGAMAPTAAMQPAPTAAMRTERESYHKADKGIPEGELSPSTTTTQPRQSVRPAEALNPPPAPATARPAKAEGPRRVGLSLEELARVATASADPILARELARLTRPAPPPEPDPAAQPLADLVARLPGRWDLIPFTTRRLTVEVGDTRAPTHRAVEAMCRAVATRTVPAAVLLDVLRQAMSPGARHRGKVLVTAWKRDASIA